MPELYEALIVGGGPSGSTAAILLARGGWRVAVLEKASFPRGKVCGEYLSATNWPLLETLGVAGRFARDAGPEVRELALLAGPSSIRAPLPRPADAPWGRALSRSSLDAMLLEEASRAGADVYQPFTVRRLDETDRGVSVLASRTGDPRSTIELRGSVAIAAHGSWDPGALPSQPPRSAPRPSDLLAFKARLLSAALPEGLMPLVTFPGGYGGMVHSDGGRVSLSACIRRDVLESLPRYGGAGPALLSHILRSTPSARAFLEGASVEDRWLSAGPIRPGFRPLRSGGAYAIGNAAGEAHPIIAEGITMALQSAGLLAEILLGLGPERASAGTGTVLGEYGKRWREAFAPRIRVAAALARWSAHPGAVRAALPLVRAFPGVLTAGARWSGKETAAPAGAPAA
jgi:flavin-dependent dehydrogenase